MSRLFAPVACALAVAGLLPAVGFARQNLTSQAPSDAAISGHVIDRMTSHPLAGTVVSVSGPGGTRRIVAGATGEFDLAVPAGSYQVRADRPGYLPVAAGQETAAGRGQLIVV